MMLITGLTVTGYEHSHAATHGPGIHINTIGHVGAFRLADGTLTYCIEVATYQPMGPQTHSERVSIVPAYVGVPGSGATFGFDGPQVIAPAMTNPVTVSRLNYILSKWGNTTNNEEAVAVALAVHLIRGDSEGMTNQFVATVRNQGQEWAYQRALVMLQEASVQARLPLMATEPAAPVFEIDETGSGTVSYGVGTTEMRLTNAVFTETGTSVYAVDGTQSGKLEVQATRPDGWDRSFDITAEIDWRSGADGHANEVWVHHPALDGQQRLVSGTGFSTGHERSGTTSSSVTVSTEWWPTITTQVLSPVLSIGEKFIDTVTVEAAPEGGSWLRSADGAYMPLILRGTLYGPLEYDPSREPLASPPADAPVATETTLMVEGPGSYEVEASITAIHTGYYTWVWAAHWDDQLPEVREPERTGESALLESRFPISDRYGESTETVLVQQRLTMVTRLDRGTVGRGWSIIDRVGVSAEQYGGWLSHADGGTIPVTMRGTVYHSFTEPSQQPSVPEDAEEIAQVFSVVWGPEIFESDEIPIPAGLEGWVVMQWCIVDEDQPEEFRGMTREWCDDYGVPHETAVIENPRVHTLAIDSVVVGEDMTDTAFIDGLIPHGAHIDFVAYLQPEPHTPKYDENWNEIAGEQWGEQELASFVGDLCKAQPVATTEAVTVTQPGEVVSPVVNTQSAGTVYWVERLWAIDPVTGQPVLIHEGECGLSEERTIIKNPDLTVELVHEAETEPVRSNKTPLVRSGATQAVLLGGVGTGLVTALTGLSLFIHGARSNRSRDS